MHAETASDPPAITRRKVPVTVAPLSSGVPDSLDAWVSRYLALAVAGVRSPAVTAKITLHLRRFTAFFRERYGHDRLSACLRRDVVAWQAALRAQGPAPATVNNQIAPLSAFTTWVAVQTPDLFPPAIRPKVSARWAWARWSRAPCALRTCKA